MIGHRRRRGQAGIPAGIDECLAGRSDVQPNRLSMMEVMAASSAKISPLRGDILGVLLDAACRAAVGGRPILMPLWTDEAMQRACHTIRLVLLLDLHTGSRTREILDIQLEHRLARTLADLFRSLAIAHDEEMLCCSEVLREIVANLADLFGSVLPHVIVRVRLERISLPANKRRALVLAASNLLMDAFCQALAGRSGGHIEVTLDLVSPASARLVVAYDSDGGCMPGRYNVVGDLAGLLEANFMYRPKPPGTTSAEIEFPFPVLLPSDRAGTARTTSRC